MRRLASVGVAFVLLAGLGGSAIAAGGGGGFGQGVGRTTQTQRTASVSLQDLLQTYNVNVSVFQGTLFFRPKGKHGPPISTAGTNLQINGGFNGIFGSDCWLIPDSMLTVNSDLSAALHFRSDDPRVTLCPGTAIVSGLPASRLVPLGSATPDLPGPPHFAGLVVVDVQWVAGSPTYEARSTTHASCGPFSGSSTLNFSDNLGSSAGGTISATVQYLGFTGIVLVPVNVTLPGMFADVNISKTKEVVNGPPTGSCGPFGS